MFWVISLAYGIAVLAIASALAFGIILSVERFAKKGSSPPRLAGHANLVWMEEVNRPRRSPGSTYTGCLIAISIPPAAR